MSCHNGLHGTRDPPMQENTLPLNSAVCLILCDESLSENGAVGLAKPANCLTGVSRGKDSCCCAVRAAAALANCSLFMFLARIALQASFDSVHSSFLHPLAICWQRRRSPLTLHGCYDFQEKKRNDSCVPSIITATDTLFDTRTHKPRTHQHLSNFEKQIHSQLFVFSTFTWSRPLWTVRCGRFFGALKRRPILLPSFRISGPLRKHLHGPTKANTIFDGKWPKISCFAFVPPTFKRVHFCQIFNKYDRMNVFNHYITAVLIETFLFALVCNLHFFQPKLKNSFLFFGWFFSILREKTKTKIWKNLRERRRYKTTKRSTHDEVEKKQEK